MLKSIVHGIFSGLKSWRLAPTYWSMRKGARNAIRGWISDGRKLSAEFDKKQKELASIGYYDLKNKCPTYPHLTP